MTNEHRMKQLYELLRKCSKVKFTIDYDVYTLKSLEEYVNELKKDMDLQTSIIRVNDKIKIVVELDK